jgi:hypothetical protein
MRKGIRWAGVVLAVVVCAVAGLLFFRRGADIVVRADAGTPTAPAGDTTFRIVSFNVQARPFLDDAAEKLPQIAERLVGYDIVAIQECFQRPELLLREGIHLLHSMRGRFPRNSSLRLGLLELRR